MEFVEASRFLVRARKCGQPRIGVKLTEKRNTRHRTRSTVVPWITIASLPRQRRIITAQTVGNDHRGMSREIRSAKL